jgi:hypothetical protein
MRFDCWINEEPITLGMHLLLQTLSSKPIAPPIVFIVAKISILWELFLINFPIGIK